MTTARNILVEEWQNVVPQNSALAMTSAVQVQNYFGVGSTEGNEALSWFANNPGSTMYFTRDRLGQRWHDLGGNIANMTVRNLQAVSGTLELDWNGWHYAGTIDNSGVSGTQIQAADETARNIAAALNKNRPTEAVVMATITPETVVVQGSVSKAQFTVTKIISDTSPTHAGVIDGAIVSGPGIATPSQESQIIHDHNPAGSKGGPGPYSLFHSTKSVASGTYTVTYGLMTVTQVISGTVIRGVQVIGPGVTGFSPQTGLVGFVSVGTGGQSTWVVDNAANIATPEQMTLKAPLIGGYINRDGNLIVGKTQNNEVIDLSTQGPFGWDTLPSAAPSYVYGTAAPLLNLTQDTGALTPSSSGNAFSVAHMMDLETGYLDQTGAPISFQDVFSNDTRLDGNIKAWADANGVNYLATFPTANVAAAHELLGGASFASHINKTRGYAETAILAASVGHAPGAA